MSGTTSGHDGQGVRPAEPRGVTVEACGASAMARLIRAAEAMPAAVVACDIASVVEAHLPPDDAAAVGGGFATELLRLALCGAWWPLPLLRMAEAAELMDYAAWRAADFPAPDIGRMMDASIAWHRAHHSGVPAGNVRPA
ncbi:hypothetical protein HB662_26925 [Roseomonas frigidaquae]|uniref:Uncharacterized protein n=1 Tax=Falsiroseomonas frigidaquae TaxID=487318 RepID=A0ABX1F887_9PROT|nr:hypothetical protein [Falsiroseomonas frigidaquae]NKE48436.1 hypothetical protein [Falsiroseomonas frigidaquae]